MTISVTSNPFDIAEETKQFEQSLGDVGAIITFSGKVRGGVADGKESVNNLYLEHFPGMTERSIEDIVNKAQGRWKLSAIKIIHRVGVLSVGEPIVLVCVASAHRREAFEAADFLMDYLKTKALFWKKEMRENGAAWIEPRSQDYQDANRWQQGEE